MKSSESTSSRWAVEIKECARTLGFELVGITSAQPPRHTEEFRQWLASDFHGEMAYMAKNAEKRVNPAAVLDDARSIVIAGMNYNTEPPREPRSERDKGTRPTTALSNPSTPGSLTRRAACEILG